MSVLLSPPARGADLVPGNTRLRARAPGLLDPERLARLPGLGLDALAAELRSTPYGRALGADRGESAGPGARREALLGAVEARRRELLTGVGTAYSGPAREVVGVLLARYDLADTLALLRGAARDLPDPEVLEGVLGVGRITPEAARSVVAEDADAVVVRLAAARLPDPGTAAAAVRAWARYAVHRDLPELETSVARAAVQGWTARLTALGRPAAPVLRLVREESDAANLVAALRLRDGGGDAAAPAMLAGALLPVGDLPERALRAVVAGADPAPLVPGPWRPVLARARGADLPALSRALAAERRERQAAGFRRGDPLSADVPIGFLARVEAEAAALRRAVLLAPAEVSR